MQPEHSFKLLFGDAARALRCRYPLINQPMKVVGPPQIDNLVRKAFVLCVQPPRTCSGCDRFWGNPMPPFSKFVSLRDAGKPGCASTSQPTTVAAV